MAITFTATGRNPSFGGSHPDADLFAFVTATGDNADLLTLTVTNVIDGAAETLLIDGTIVALVTGQVITSGGLTVDTTLVGTTATVTITMPPGGITAAELQTLVDDLVYQNSSPTPGVARRVVTLTEVSDVTDPGTQSLSIASTASPPGVIELVSVSSDGVQVTSAPSPPLDTVSSVSADGRYVVFVGSDPNLVTGDGNGVNDIYLRDRVDGTTVLVSLASDESQASASSSSPSISDDGRFVAFITTAQLVSSDLHAGADLYVRDLQDGTTLLVSIGSGANGVIGNSAVNDGEISGNGGFAVFTSFADTLLGLGGDTNSASDVFVRDLTTLTTERVSVANDGSQATGGASSLASISANGTRIAFQSTATNLIGVGADNNLVQDIFLRDTATDSTLRISVGLGGVDADGISFSAAISGDGNRVAFVSAATNLVASDTNGAVEDIFVRDIAAGTTIRISGAGLNVNGASTSPSISADGRFVTFENDFNIWVYDVQTAQLLRLTVPESGLNSTSSKPVISDDGSTVVFFNANNDLVPYDANNPGVFDVLAAPVNFSQPPTLDLDASNSTPPLTGFTTSYSEDDATGVLIADNDVEITDADVGDMIESATIAVQSPVAGDQLTLGDQVGFAIAGSGTATITITGSGTADQYEAIIEQIRFLSTSDDPTLGGQRLTRTINSVVNDGTSNSLTAITTVNITATNDEPTLEATGVNPTFVENGPAVDLYQDVTASAIEAGQEFRGLVLTVSNVIDGATPGQDEILTINGVDVALNNGNSVSLGGLALISVSLPPLSTIATVTIANVNFTAAELQTLIDGMTYRNLSEPSLAARTITITEVSDEGSNVDPNDNTTDLNIVTTVSLLTGNDPPDAEITPLTFGPVNEQTDLDLKNNGMSVSDPDAAGGAVIVTLSVDEGKLIVTAGTSGAIVSNSGTGSVTITGTITQINALLNTDGTSVVSYNNDTDAPLASVTLTLHIDDQGNSSSPPPNPLADQDTATIDITAVNDAPELTAVPAFYQGPPNTAIFINNITFADVDGLGGDEVATFTAPDGTFAATDNFGVTVTGGGTSITLTGTIANLNTFIANNQLSYTVAASQVITVEINDQGNTGTGVAEIDTANIPVNISFPPIIADLGGDTSTFTEEAPPVLLDDSSPPELAATVTDGDSLNLDTGNLTVSIIGSLVAGEDVLGIATTANVTLSGSNVLFDTGSGPVVIGTFAGGTGGSNLVVSFNANATLDAVGFLINALTYSNSNTVDPSALQRTITVSVSDGITSSSQDVLVNVLSVNEAPTIQFLNGDAVTFLEDGPAVNLDLAVNAAVNDTDSSNFDTGSLAVSITSGKVATEDELQIDQTGAVTIVLVPAGRAGFVSTVVINGTTTIGILSSTGGAGGGDLVAAFNSDATPAAIAELIRAIQYFNSNGDDPTAGVRELTFTLVDGDGQANGGADTATAITTVTVNQANDDPAAVGVPADVIVVEDILSDLDLSAITLTDVDSDPDNVTLTLAASGGILTAASGGGVTVGGSGTGTVTLTGAVGDIDGFLDAASNIQYTTALNAAGDDVATLTLTANDGGHNGIGGGSDVALGIVNIDSTAVNDDPTVNAPAALAGAASVAVTITGITFADIDGNGGSETATFTAPTGTFTAVNGGGVTVGGSGTNALTLDGTTADLTNFIAGNNLSFTTATETTVTVQLNDLGNTGTGGSLVASTSFDITFDLPPTAALVGPFVGTEDAASPLRVAIALSGTDPDVGDAVESFTIATLAANGQLFNFATGGVALSTGAVIPATGSGPWTGTVFFQPNADWNGSTSFTYTAFDGELDSAAATALISIGAVQDIANDTATKNGALPINIAVLANDTFEGTPAITGTTNGAHGTVTINNNGTPGTADDFVVYTPVGSFFGPDSFTYTVTSGGVTETATVQVDERANNAQDFNGDGKSDILWQNDNGQPGIWLMDGFNVLQDGGVGFNPGPTWDVKGSGDFNGDGKADILWQNDNGQAGVWLMNGLNVIADGGVGVNPGPTWNVIDAGDFNGDGKSDILWQNDNGQAGIWLMDGLNVIADGGVGFNPGPSWNVKAAADFNGDGKADILWQNDNGQAGIWLMDGLTVLQDGGVGFNPGSSWKVMDAGDFNSDGKADILWQNDNGQAGIWLMNGLTVVQDGGVGFNPGPTWNVEAAGDHNGDGKADILWQNDNGAPGVWLMDGLNVLADSGVGFNPGPSWQVVGQNHDLI